MTQGTTKLKITLTGSLVYYFTAWARRLAGQDAILGMYFKVPAGTLQLHLSHGIFFLLRLIQSLMRLEIQILSDEVQFQLRGRRPLYGVHT